MGGFDRLWDPKIRKRAQEMRDKYGDDALIIINYAFLGAAAEMQKFLTNYEDQFQYVQKKGWPLPARTPEDHKRNVRAWAAGMSLDESIEAYLFCPFMKELTQELATSGVFDPLVVRDVMCYVTNGKPYDEFLVDDQFRIERQNYLTRTGILG